MRTDNYQLRESLKIFFYVHTLQYILLHYSVGYATYKFHVILVYLHNICNTSLQSGAYNGDIYVCVYVCVTSLYKQGIW